jgi:hypothetical protein
MQKFTNSNSAQAANQNYQIQIVINNGRGTVLVKPQPPKDRVVAKG